MFVAGVRVVEFGIKRVYVVSRWLSKSHGADINTLTPVASLSTEIYYSPHFTHFFANRRSFIDGDSGWRRVSGNRSVGRRKSRRVESGCQRPALASSMNDFNGADDEE